MLVEIVHIDPTDSEHGWRELKDALSDSPMIAVIVDDTVGWRALMGVARVVALSDARVVAAFGSQSEKVHDLVDLIALSEREFGPITTWDDHDDLEDFMRSVTFTYRGMLDVADQNRKTVICHASKTPIPETLALAFAKMQKQEIE